MSHSQEQLIPPALLQNSTKLLFLTHCALGDFTYLQAYFKKVAQTYPHIKIDFWIDEVRRTYFFWRWKYLKKYILYDWAHSCSFFYKIYTQTYSWGLFKKSIKEARKESYPLVVSLCTLRSRKYARWARKISPNGFIVGIKSKRGNVYKQLDAELPYALPEAHKPFEWHITDLYNYQFKLLFGIELTAQERFPQLVIPVAWQTWAQELLTEWKVNDGRPLIFINAFAKDKKRCWSIDKIPVLIALLQKQERYEKAAYIINAPPEHYDVVAKKFSGAVDHTIFLLKASDHFFQLPAILEQATLIISVETSIIHFAAALKKRLVPLMRRKSPEWLPLGHDPNAVVVAALRGDWISSIPVQQVIAALVS